jgi:hypothetical protein
MVLVATTRFTAQTYAENLEYRKRKGLACVYGLQEPMSDRCAYGAEVFVFEMNNDTNRIEGIGLIRNVHTGEKHTIHSNNQYNLCSYVGSYHLTRDQLLEHCNPQWLMEMEELMFKGKSNLKRLTGIRLLTDKLLRRKERTVDETEKGLRILFGRVYNKKKWVRPVSMMRRIVPVPVSASASSSVSLSGSSVAPSP